jgi:DNA-binding transcriptional ArsR family regulator
MFFSPGGGWMTEKIRMDVPYFQVPNSIFDLDIIISVDETVRGRKMKVNREMRASEKLIYIYLCRCANQGSRAFPSYADIARKCGISKRTAIRAIEVLRENGFLKKFSRRLQSNVYELAEPEEIAEIDFNCE